MSETTNAASQAEQEFNSVMEKVDEYLGLEEVTIVYRGIKQPHNASQLSVELAALKHVRQVIDTRISSLEFDFTLHLEKLKLSQAIAKKQVPTVEVPQSTPSTETQP